ncbi:hypothetical protein ACIQNI_31955 [Streptomyces sp. NPDC091266]|uniref:terpene synthase family protein n=1 Tax=Streptomyces sp. NPDC091266 TaxID=3365978 RepID=UPI00382AD60E
MQPLPYRIPPLYWPVPLKTNPQAEKLRRRLEEELEADGVLDVPRYRSLYEELDLPGVVCDSHPYGDFEGAVLCAVIEAWAFLCDDPRHPQWIPPTLLPDLSSLNAQSLLDRAHDPAIYEAMTDPLERCMATSLRKIAAYAAPDKATLYAQRIVEWILAEADLILDQSVGTVRTLNDLLASRTTNDGMLVVEAYSACSFPELSLAQVTDPQVRSICLLANIAIAAHNELYSGYFDHAHDLASNFIHAYMREEGIGLQEAADRVTELADRAAAECMRQFADLRTTASPSLIEYVEVNLAYVTTALEWYPGRMAGRYAAPDLDLSTVTLRYADKPAALGPPGIPSIDHLWTHRA